jgi:DNA segregation ATPase FtsK/SpoIIIE, S-DNA-T family
MACAAGIHLVLITQRPDKDCRPLQARENLANRLALQAQSEANDNLAAVPGAEGLLGKGHLAARPPSG